MRKLLNIPYLVTLGLVMSAATANAQAPAVTTDPSATAACEGAIANFSVAATGATSYSWQESADGTAWTTLADGGMYSGTTTASLSVSAAMPVNGYWYRAIAINTDGQDTSTNAMLTVNALPVAGSISGAGRVCMGNSISLTPSISGGTWSSSSIAIATVDAGGNVFGVAPGWDTITYTVSSASCGDAVTTHLVRVDEPVSSSPIIGSTNVCVGASISLSNAAGVGVWSASNDNATIGITSGMLSGNTAGRDTITYAFSNACGSFSVSTVITIETPLSAGTISGPDYVCVGSPAVFTATSPDGIWVSSDGTVASVDMPGLITGRAQGTAVISYIVSNSCGSQSALDTIMVERPASVITGPDSVGIGSMITLTDSAMGGTWTSVDVTIAEVDHVTGVVNGIATGTTNIEYTVTNACGTTTMVKSIEVGPAPSAGSISGSDTVCVGSSITLTPSVIGGMWTASNASATVDASGMVTGVTGGMRDTITYTVSNGFGTTTVRKVIYVNQAPVITITGPSSVSLGTGYTLVATPTGGTWVSTNDTAVIFISANTFVAIRRGVTNLIYTVSNTCGTSSDTFVVNLPIIVDTTVGVEHVAGNNSSISIFPNPNNGTFNLNINTASNEMANVVVTNMVGAVVSEAMVETNKSNNIAINQPAGIYFVTATVHNDKYIARIVVTK